MVEGIENVKVYLETGSGPQGRGSRKWETVFRYGVWGSMVEGIENVKVYLETGLGPQGRGSRKCETVFRYGVRHI